MGTRERLRTNTSGTPRKTQLRADQRVELALEKNASREGKAEPASWTAKEHFL